MAQQQPPGQQSQGQQQAQAGGRLPSHLLPRPKATATANASSPASLEALRAATPDHLHPPHTGARTRSPHRLRAVRGVNDGSGDADADTTAAAGEAGAQTSGTTTSAAAAAGGDAKSRLDASDAATEVLIRRVLCPFAHDALHGPQALDELLPPLTSSNEVDLQLYAILAIVIREFVASWYGRITPDQTFVEEIVRIIAHCTRDLEQRLRRVDAPAILLDEIPTLIQNHVNAYRAATDPQRSSSALAPDPRAVYHALNPHPAFEPIPKPADPAAVEAQAANESYYRQLLVHGALAVLLPTEDLHSPPLRILVADVLGEMILGRGIGQRACERWLLWEGITKAIVALKNRLQPKATGEEIEVDAKNRLEQFGLLAEQSAAERASQARSRRSSFSELFWRVLQYGYLAYLTIRFLITGLIAAASAPPLRRRRKAATDPSFVHGPKERGGGIGQSPMTSSVEAPVEKGPQPILSYALLDLVGDLLELRWRAPWTLGSLAFVRWHLTQSVGWLRGIGATDGLVDKFLNVLIGDYLLTPSRIPQVFLQLRLALFPNNALAPQRLIPPLEEQLEIRRRAAEAVLSLFPTPVARRLFSTRLDPSGVSGTSRLSRNLDFSGRDSRPYSRSPSSHRDASRPSENDDDDSSIILDPENEAVLRDIEGILDVLDDPYMNKHLIFGIVELLFVRLMPELGEKGVRELLEDRGVAV